MSIRIAEYTISDMIINRWSARAMSGESITNQELYPLFEAARWAPSCYNSQPWCFVYTHRADATWESFLNLLVPFNQSWAKDAACLIILASNTLFEKTGKPYFTHAFDTGSAWENFALQGVINGLVVHAMAGFDYKAAHTIAQLPETYEVLAMIAVGKPGNPQNLPDDLKERETMSDRKKITDFIYNGHFR